MGADISIHGGRHGQLQSGKEFYRSDRNKNFLPHEEAKVEKVVIVGGGHVGITLAVDLHQRRHETQLDPHIVLLRGRAHPFLARDETHDISIENIISGEQTTHRFPKDNRHPLEGDTASLLRDCGFLIIAVPDIPVIRKWILAWLKSNLVVRDAALVYVRGGQGGMINLVANHRDSAALSNASIGLVEDSFYGTRFISDKIEFKRKRITNVALAGSHPDKAIALLRRAFSGPSIGRDWHQFNPVRLLDLQFDPLGYIIHLGVALDDKNLERTRRGDQYLHYCEGVHSGNAGKLERLDAERVALAEDFGAKTRPFTVMLQEQYGLAPKPTFLETMQSTKSIYRSRSAASISDLKEGRVLQEDIPALLTIDWLARKTSISLPETQSHTDEMIRKITSLGVDKESVYGYRRQLEQLSLQKSDVIELLTSH